MMDQDQQRDYAEEQYWRNYRDEDFHPTEREAEMDDYPPPTFPVNVSDDPWVNPQTDAYEPPF